MDRGLVKIWNFVAQDRSLTLQRRIFRLICLVTAMLCLLVALPTNLLQPDMPMVANLCVLVIGLAALAAYQCSRRGRDYTLTLLAVVIVLLDVIWVFDGGSTGSNTYYFQAIILYPVALWRGRKRWIISGLILLNISALFTFEYCFPGYVLHFENRLELMFDDLTGAIAATIGVALITWAILTSYDWEQTQLSVFTRELETSEANYRNLVENCLCIILRVDARGRIIFINKFAENLLGCQRTRVLGRSALGTIVPATPAGGELLAGLLQRPEAFASLQQEIPGPGDRRLWIRWGNVPTYNPQGQLHEILCVGTDLTELKEAEEKRRQDELKLQNLQRLESLGILAGGIAHDFNNLLTAILGNISLMKMDMPPGGAPAHELEAAEAACLQARDLTAQLLTFAKGGKPVKSPLSLKSLLRSSANFVLRSTPCQCQLKIEDNLLRVNADAAQMTQVFNNLLLNATQAMGAGGVVTVQARNQIIIQPHNHILPPGEYVEITVQDTGHGIAPEHLSKIFDPYFTTKEAGSGLGLAVVHSIIKNHDGVITARSIPGAGTAFVILLPVVPAGATATSFLQAAPAAIGHRILIMDDDVQVRKLLSRLLTRLGYSVEAVADGAAALESYQQAVSQNQPFALVVMDLNIRGGMGGQEAIGHLLAAHPGARAVVSSGYSDSPVMADYAAFGFQGVITKPYTADQLKLFMETMLAS